MRKKALAEEVEEVQQRKREAAAEEVQKKRTVVLMPRPPLQWPQDQQTRAAAAAKAVPKAFVKRVELMTATAIPRNPAPRPPMPKFVILPAQKPYPIVEKSGNSLPNQTHSRSFLQGNVSKLFLLIECRCE